jgi:hypothetical protein
MNSGDTGSLMQRCKIASMSPARGVDVPATDLADRIKVARPAGAP